MPVLAFPSRYRPKVNPFEPGLMSPIEDLDPAFNPRALEEPIVDVEAVRPKMNAPEAMPSPAQRSQPAIMPPPGMPMTAQVPEPKIPTGQQYGPQAPPSIPPPPLPEAPAPVVNIPGPGPQKMRASEMAPKPPSNSDIQLEQATQKLKDVQAQKPAVPKNNWLQRIALGTLALTKFAPIADQLVHPVWADQEWQHNRDVDVAQDQFNTAKAAIDAEGLKEKREAEVAYKEGQTENTNMLRDQYNRSRDPHFGMQEVNAEYAKQNLPWLQPDAEGRFWVDKSIGNTLTKPESDPKPMVVAPGGTVIDQKGNVLYTAPQKEDEEKVGNAFQEAVKAFKITNGRDPNQQEIIDIQRKIERPQTTNNINLSDDALTQNALRYIQTGQMPALGNGAGPLRQAIMNRAAELQGGDSLGLNAAIYKGDAQALGKLKVNQAAVLAFENTARGNLDRFIEAAKGIVDTGSPLANRVFREGARVISGSDAQAQADAARTVAYTEISRVLNGSLSGMLSDSSRKEAEQILDGNYTLPQLLRAANLIKQDMEGRKVGFATEIAGIENRMRLAGGGAPPPVPAPQTPPAQPAPTPQPGGKVFTQADVDAAVAATPGLTPAAAEAAFKAKGWVKK